MLLRLQRHFLRPSFLRSYSTGTFPPISLFNFLTSFLGPLISLTFQDGDGELHAVSAAIGKTLLDVAHENDVELEGACGGELACSTCHCIFTPEIFTQLPEVGEEEEDMLDLAWGLTDTSRLGCQIKVEPYMEKMMVTIPAESDDLS